MCLNRNFERIVILADDFLEEAYTESPIRDLDGASTFLSDSVKFSSDDEDFEESNISETGKERRADPSSAPFLTSKNSEGDTLSIE